MTLEEKAKLLCGGTFFGTNGIESEGIPAIKLLDGGTGMNFEQMIGDSYKDITGGYTGKEIDNVTRYYFDDSKLNDREKELRDKIVLKLQERTGFDDIAPGCYPPGILLGSTWNKETINKVGEALGMEAMVYRISILLGTPNCNLLREPLNGRFFEGYSEDPYLTAELAEQMVLGVESTGVASNTKHFAANNLEFNRVGIDQSISQRALREMYFPAFKKLSENTATFMASYPSINGKPCTENDWLINKVLRDEWGFKGMVMTDWGACTGKTGDSVNCGIDLMMPGPWSPDDIVLAVKEGRLSEEKLDAAVERMKAVVEKYKDIKKPDELIYEDYIERGDRACYEAAAEGIVLLQNNDCMPISEDDNVIIFGDEFRNCGDGSAQVFTPRQGEFGFKNCTYNDFEMFGSDKNAKAVVICSLASAEGTDRRDIKMDEKTIDTLTSLATLKNINPTAKIILVLNTPGPVELGEFINVTDAVLAVFYPGMMGKRALTDIITGKVNPSGALPFTFPVRYEDTPAFLCYPDSYKCTYGEGIFVGYRGYQKRKLSPLFPFGHGLSYSKFDISDVSITNSEVNMGDEVEVKFTLKNLSDRAGKKVVQLYSSDPESLVIKPLMELRAFDKLYLEGNESKEFTLKFNSEDLKFYSEDFEKFLVEDGYYNLYIGFSCEDIMPAGQIYLSGGSEELRPGGNWSFEQIYKYPELHNALIKGIEDKGMDPHTVTDQLRYTPFNKVCKLYPDWKEMGTFVEAVNNFRRP